jgi:ADP-heptose:LPS heptosyltransferase
VKPKLLIIELWGLGDLVLATPFLQAASQRFELTLLAKPYALELQRRFWPGVKVLPFTAPWTAFQGKYRIFSWPWKDILGLRKLVAERVDVGLSARWDPRDHFLLQFSRARRRIGFPRLGSQRFLTEALPRPDPAAHRYEHWRALARSLDLRLSPREELPLTSVRSEGEILVHTGAGQPVRVWPLPRYRSLAARLRQAGRPVQIACDPDQRSWWLQAGESAVATPTTVSELFALIDRAALFVGNDSGPGHLAAFCGVPTFTVFGPQLPEWFAPLHPESAWIQGKACPFKPCSDYCRFETPRCIMELTEDEVWPLVNAFLNRTLGIASVPVPLN